MAEKPHWSHLQVSLRDNTSTNVSTLFTVNPFWRPRNGGDLKQFPTETTVGFQSSSLGTVPYTLQDMPSTSQWPMSHYCRLFRVHHPFTSFIRVHWCLQSTDCGRWCWYIKTSPQTLGHSCSCCLEGTCWLSSLIHKCAGQFSWTCRAVFCLFVFVLLLTQAHLSPLNLILLVLAHWSKV